MKKPFGLFVIVIFSWIFCNAQQVVSSGGYSVKAGITVDWILGGSLTDISANNQSTFYEVQKGQSTVFGFPFKVYPTLTNSIITIETPTSVKDHFLLELYSNSGVLVIDRITMDQSIRQVNLSSLTAGVYYLKVIIQEKKQSLPLVKIVKI